MTAAHGASGGAANGTEWTVCKLGGSLHGGDVELLALSVLDALQRGLAVALVHGGGPRISRALAEEGVQLSFVNGERATSSAAMATVKRVLVDEVNAELCRSLTRYDVPVVSVNGAEGLLTGTPVPGLMQTGRVANVCVQALATSAYERQVPVIAPIGRDAAGRLLNINADLAAGAIAGALAASRLVFLTDVPGIYENWETRQLLSDTSAHRLRQLQADNRFHSGMIPKVSAVLHALDCGVQEVRVVDGADADAIRWALDESLVRRQQADVMAIPGTRIRNSEEVMTDER